jgi:hypothetical protein
MKDLSYLMLAVKQISNCVKAGFSALSQPHLSLTINLATTLERAGGKDPTLTKTSLVLPSWLETFSLEAG